MKSSNTAEAKLFKRLFVWLLISSFGIYTLLAVVIKPLYIFVYNDATIRIDYLTDIINLSANFLDFISFSVCYAILIYILYRFGRSKATLPIISFAIATAYKFFAIPIFCYAVYNLGPIGDVNFIEILIYLMIEEVKHLIVIFTALAITGKHAKLASIAKKGAMTIGEDHQYRDKVFPFTKLFSLKNPLQRSAIAAMIVIIVFGVTTLLIPDVLYGGLPQDLIDAFWIAIYYGSAILSGLIGYFIMIFVFNRFDIADLRTRLSESK